MYKVTHWTRVTRGDEWTHAGIESHVVYQYVGDALAHNDLGPDMAVGPDWSIREENGATVATRPDGLRRLCAKLVEVTVDPQTYDEKSEWDQRLPESALARAQGESDSEYRARHEARLASLPTTRQLVDQWRASREIRSFKLHQYHCSHAGAVWVASSYPEQVRATDERAALEAGGKLDGRTFHPATPGSKAHAMATDRLSTVVVEPVLPDLQTYMSSGAAQRPMGGTDRTVVSRRPSTLRAHVTRSSSLGRHLRVESNAGTRQMV